MFFVNDTETTEIYTYGHTLSLHDSLPIYVLFVSRILRDRPPPAISRVMAAADFSRIAYAGMSFGGSTAVSACDADPDCVAAVDLDGENFDGDQFDRELRAPLLLMLTDQPFSDVQRRDPEFNPTDYAWEKRSEEHTSELQSLMRISYAVFCLKKKKT